MQMKGTLWRINVFQVTGNIKEFSFSPDGWDLLSEAEPNIPGIKKPGPRNNFFQDYGL